MHASEATLGACTTDSRNSDLVEVCCLTNLIQGLKQDILGALSRCGSGISLVVHYALLEYHDASMTITTLVATPLLCIIP